MGCTCKKPKVTKVKAEQLDLPETGYQFIDPYAEDISRRILSAYFGSPGEYEGLIAQERDIPIEGTADLTDLERDHLNKSIDAVKELINAVDKLGA